MSASLASASTAAAPASFLRKVLWADAAVSAAAGAVMCFGGGLLASPLGLPTHLLMPAGLSLFVYAAFVLWLARRPLVPRAGVWAAVVINVVWAVDCLAIAFGPWYAPTGLGVVFLVAQVVTVGVFAELQAVGLRRAD